ncbi:MAG TPA: hypothetical protein VFU02_20865 [Polyangiaceae bacterium]|nr:hypothetical protein [Polyangiaceae bacterium]
MRRLLASNLPPVPLRGCALALALALAAAACAAEAPERKPPASAPPSVAVPLPASENTPAGPSSASPACEDVAFAAVWPRLRAHLEAGLEGLAPLVDPAAGVFVIDNPGAFIVPMHFGSIAEAGERVPKLTAEHYQLKCPEPRTDSTPQYSCETEEWSPSGCVLTPDPSFSVARWYELALKYEILPAAEASAGLERARQADAAISHGVYATSYELGFYFGRVGCAWRVLAIDTVIPCSA